MDLENIDNIDKEKAKEILNHINKELIKHNKAYYVDNAPLISDSEYDFLFNYFKKLSEKFPAEKFPDIVIEDNVLKTIGHEVADKFKKVSHSIPMLSLDNAFDEEDLQNFVERCQKFLLHSESIPICCEPKIDGLSFAATFEKGILIQVATRGDGYIGEDITRNVKTIKNFPHSIKTSLELFEVRGEIYMNKEDFIELNKNQQQANKQIFANPRNAAAGSIRQLDSFISASRPLKYFVYSVGNVMNDNQSVSFASHQDQLIEKLESLGFQTNPYHTVANSIAQITEFYEHMLNIRENMPYEIDGVVCKVNEFALQERLGFVGRAPRHTIAYKFPSNIVLTKLLDVIVQVGRTGALTPVGVLQPVSIAGATISKATLHNYEDIQRKGIKIGDWVLLVRSGDVIPKVLEVDLNKRNKESNLQDIKAPEFCPSCGKKLIVGSDTVIRCNNFWECKDQIYARIVHFVSRDALNIVGLGKKQIETLISEGLISNILDIYSITKEQLEVIEGLGKKSAINILNNIEASKNVPLDRFIYSLGMRYIGGNNSKLLAKEFKNIHAFINFLNTISQNEDQGITLEGNLVNTEQINIEQIDGLGNKSLEGIKEFANSAHNIEIVSSLASILNISGYKQAKSSSVTGKNVIFTGTLKSLSRSEAKAKAIALGADVRSAISSNIDIVVIGEKVGSKLKKATELGLKILTEEEWLKLINK